MILKRTWAFINYLIGEYGRDNCNQLAAAISYYVLFSIVPFTLLTVSVFGVVVGKDQIQKEITPAVVDFIGLREGTPAIEVDRKKMEEKYGKVAADQITAAAASLTAAEATDIANRLDNDPPSEVTIGDVALSPDDVTVNFDNSVASTLREVSHLGAPLTVVGLIALAWSGSAMFGAVRRALQAVWKVERQRPFFQQKTRDVLMTGTLGLLVLFSIVSTGFLQAARQLSDRALGPLSTNTSLFWSALPYLLPFIVSLLVFALAYRFGPGVPVMFRNIIPGALFAAVAFEILKNVFAFYVSHFRAYDIIYGSLGGILLFLTSVYLSAAILLAGAEIVLAIPLLRAGDFDPVVDPLAPRRPFFLRAARDLGRFVRGLFVANPDAPAPHPGRPRR